VRLAPSIEHDSAPQSTHGTNGRDGPEEPLEVLDADADQAAAEAGRGQMAMGNPASEGVDADAVDGRRLLEGEPLSFGFQQSRAMSPWPSPPRPGATSPPSPNGKCFALSNRRPPCPPDHPRQASRGRLKKPTSTPDAAPGDGRSGGRTCAVACRTRGVGGCYRGGYQIPLASQRCALGGFSSSRARSIASWRTRDDRVHGLVAGTCTRSLPCPTSR